MSSRYHIIALLCSEINPNTGSNDRNYDFCVKRQVFIKNHPLRI
jgi:hypothetical protein